MKKHLEYRDEKSQKFWEIEVIDNTYTVRFGKIGTDGQSKTKTFSSNEDAAKEAENVIKSKLKKGYLEQGVDNINDIESEKTEKSEIALIWEAIVKHEKAEHSDYPKLNKGTSQKEISELEQYIQKELPSDFVEFYKICNGAELNDLRILSLAEIKTSWEYLCSIAGNSIEDDGLKETDYSIEYDECVKQFDTVNNKDRIPIASDPDQEFLFLDFNPTDSGNIGQVICLRDECTMHVIAESFCEFLNYYLMLKKAEKDIWDDTFGFFTEEREGLLFDLEKLLNPSRKNKKSDKKSGKKISGKQQLIEAVEHNDLKLVTSLLESGSDPNAKTSNGNNAMQAAVVKGHVAMVQLQLDYGGDANLIVSDGYNVPILSIALSKGDEDMVNLLCENGANCISIRNGEDYSVFYAVMGGNISLVKKTIESGCNVNVEDGYFGTPLMGVWSTETVFSSITGENDRKLSSSIMIETAELLLENGADINFFSPVTYIPGTPLSNCVFNANIDGTRFLLGKGANVKLSKGVIYECINGMPNNKKRRLEIIKLLLDNNADINDHSIYSGHTALTACVKCNFDLECFKFLLEHGADINTKVKGNYGYTPLIEASSALIVKLVEFLIQHGADCNLRDDKGETALMHASGTYYMNHNYIGKKERKEHIEIVKLLLDANADPLIKNKQGFTALSIAKNEERYEIAKLIQTAIDNVRS